MKPHFREKGPYTYYLEERLRQVVRIYQDMFAEEIALNFLNEVVFQIKKKIQSNPSWEPQFLVYVALGYTLFNHYQKAIDLSLYAQEQTKRYSKDVPANYKLFESLLKSYLMNWYLSTENFSKYEELLEENVNENPSSGGHGYLKLKKYEKAKACFKNTISEMDYDRAFIYELLNLCNKKLNMDGSKYLEKALEVYENNNPQNNLDTRINELRIFRVKDALFGFDHQRHSVFLDELKMKELVTEKDRSPCSLIFYLGLMGMCYYKIGEMEKSFRCFDKKHLIDILYDDICEPDRTEFNRFIHEELFLNEKYKDKYGKRNSRDPLLEYLFTDDDFIKYVHKSKKEYFKEGIQSDPNEVICVFDLF